ncbi:hypothetical protein MMC26_004970 [Xylographa opegraphella]|nr:hypothetical protein [Xylographa opegraphella]
MGNDGGSIPKRRELVKEAARLPTSAEIKESQQEQQAYHWTTCPLSHEPLKQPVVSDSAGILYNKDSVLEYLLPQDDETRGRSKADDEEVLGGRVRSLKDVVEVKFEVERNESGREDGKASPRKSKWICPITNKVLGPGVRAVYLVPCGHAFLESTVKEIQAEACLQCNEAYTPESIILILPTLTADKEHLDARIQSLKDQGLTHSLKKVTGSGKKRKKNEDTGKAQLAQTSLSNSATEAYSLAGLSQNHSGVATPKGRIQNATTASLTAKVLAEEEVKAKRRKLDANPNLKSLFSSGKAKHRDVAKFYKSQDSFTCLSNPSIKLPSSNVNDDYCDCPDGSDEPGTSACSYISALSPPTLENYAPGNFNVTPALPGFYCKNKGHQPSYIPFLSVNDGLCDYDQCCDGSNEWAQVGGVSCPDKCKEIGKEWRKQNEQRQKSMSNAARKRKELVTEAQRLRKEVEDQIENLGIKVKASEVKVKALEEQLAETERKERGKVVKAPEKAGKMSILVNLAKDRIEELRTFLVDVRSQRDQGRERIKELETILTTFKEEYNPNFNDEGVKRAVRSWEEYAARDKPDDTDAAHERDLDEVSKADSETGNIVWEDWQDSGESDVELLYKFEEYLPVTLRGWLDQKLRDLRILLVENGIIAASGGSDSESKAVTDARSALKSAQEDLEKNKKQVATHEGDLEKDYGIDDVFRALKGQCISTDSGEYSYELCWLDRTKQKSKKSGGDTNLGNFVRIESITVDDDVPPDGRGVGSGERVAMKHENGQHCWNGPNRSTTIVLACAEKDEIWKIVEEEKCVYRMEVGTPAVCEGTSGVGTGTSKDEL